jgi:predicted metal-dependent hydrolase
MADAPLRPGAVLRHLALPGGALRYGLLRARRRTLTIVVQRGAVEVRAPRWTPLGEVERFLREKEHWIRRRLAESRRLVPAFTWQSGESLPFLGESIVLAPDATVATTTQVGQRLIVAGAGTEPFVDAPALRKAVIAWLRDQALALFAQRVAEYAPRLEVPVPLLGLSNARTQWGSCNARGRILLNWRLIHVPVRLVDYVVAHELAHLREMNHSRRFWALVECAYPGWRAARVELNGIEKRIPNL